MTDLSHCDLHISLPYAGHVSKADLVFEKPLLLLGHRLLPNLGRHAEIFQINVNSLLLCPESPLLVVVRV